MSLRLFNDWQYVLLPQLFLTYINDLPNKSNSSIRLYSDDHVLNREIRNELIRKESKNTKWEYDWRMHFFAQHVFVVRLTHARHITRFNYTLGDTSLQETDNHPYVGVHIIKDLTWHKHIHQITATANHTLAFVRLNLSSCPHNSNKTICLHNSCSPTSWISIIREGPPHQYIHK